MKFSVAYNYPTPANQYGADGLPCCPANTFCAGTSIYHKQILRLPYSILMLIVLHHEWPILVLGTGLVGCVLVLLFLKTVTGVELLVTLGCLI